MRQLGVGGQSTGANIVLIILLLQYNQHNNV
jgi:hypothetical protein